MSANFPIFHGVTLAAGATLDNLNVEILASDPSPVSAGRIWFNSTTKQLKYSSLNSGGAVIVVANVVAADVAAALSSSESYTDAAIAGLVDTAPALLNTLNELAAAIADDANFATTVTAQIAAAKSEIQDGVSGAFDTLAEVETALGVINGGDTVTGSIAKAVKTEKTRAEGAESTLTGAVTLLNNTDTTSGSVAYAVKTETTRATGVEGALVSLTTTAKGTLVAAVNDVDARLGTVETAVNGKIGDLTSLTTVAQGTLVAAINEVDAQRDTTAAALATEITNRTTAVSGEATTRLNADNALSGRLDTVEGSGAGSITAAIVAEALSRTNAATTEHDLRVAAEGSEATTRLNADNALSGRLDTVEGSGAGSITAAVLVETNARSAADTTLTAAVALLNNADDTVTGSVAKSVKTETTRATTAESALGTRIDNVLSNVTAGSLDSLTELVTAFQAADGDLQTAINDLSSGAGSNLADEEARAIAAEEAIASDLVDETTRAETAEGVLTNAVTLLNNTAGTSGSVAFKVAGEATIARAAELALGGRLDTVEGSGAGSITAAIVAEALARTNAASTEQGLRVAAEGVLTTAVTLLNNTDTTNGSVAYAVKTETTRATGAETTLTSAVTLLNNTDTTSGSVAYAVKTETTRATGVEGTLTSAVTLINNTDTTNGSFAYAVKTEKTRAEAAEAQIRTDINAGNVTFQSGATATTHTFSHNLNSDFITFSVMVLRDDGKYRNDIVSVEAYDANTLKVYLTEARHVRVSAVSMTSL